eukprot:NODE_127_length_17034_cov_0.369590.p4 type:complete len:298 gc:universal NODE_127_length_17034_cov_0.369590:12203-11310(-)
MLLIAVITSTLCVVGAGPSGTTLAWQLTQKYPKSSMYLFDSKFQGGEISKFKSYSSNAANYYYGLYGQKLKLKPNMIHAYDRIMNDYGLPSLGHLVNMTLEMHDYMSKSRKFSKIKAHISEMQIIKKDQYILNHKYKCSKVFMASGGHPRPISNELKARIGNATVLNMYEALNYPKLVENLQLCHRMYIVGDGATSEWIQRNLRKAMCISFTIIHKYTKLTDFQFVASDVIIMAAGFESNGFPHTIYQNQPIQWSKTKDFEYRFDQFVIYGTGIGFSNQSPGYYTFSLVGDQIVSSL